MHDNDLISRSALLEEISKCTIRPNDLYEMGIMSGVDATKKIVETAPAVDAVDAVEVVRCKECKFYEIGVEYYGGGTKDICRLLKRQMLDDDFCSYGERRADDG